MVEDMSLSRCQLINHKKPFSLINSMEGMPLFSTFKMALKYIVYRWHHNLHADARNIVKKFF